MINTISLQEQINNEFHTGYIYLNMEDEKLAKEKIETGLRYYFNSLNQANTTIE